MVCYESFMQVMWKWGFVVLICEFLDTFMTPTAMLPTLIQIFIFSSELYHGSLYDRYYFHNQKETKLLLLFFERISSPFVIILKPKLSDG